jgi:hypothetical protein
MQIWKICFDTSMVGDPGLFGDRRIERHWTPGVPHREQRLQVMDPRQLRVSEKLQFFARKISTGHSLQQLHRGRRERPNPRRHQTGTFLVSGS